MVSDRDRRDLYGVLHDHFGEGPADTMMDLLPPVGRADVARVSDIEARRIELRGEIRGIRSSLVYHLGMVHQ